MTLRTRRVVFYAFIFIFIAAGIGVVFYSQGWRPVWQNNGIAFQKVGGIFVETNPKNVQIKIAGKTFEDKSGLLQSGTFITDLLPKNYKVDVEKSGYYGWQKTVSVKSGMVAETGKIILVPEKISALPISTSTDISAFWENGQNFIFLNKGILYYFDQKTATKIKGNNLTAWSDDGSKFITQDAKTQIYYLYNTNDVSKAAGLNFIFNNLAKTAISEIVFHPADSGKLIIKGKTGLYIFDTNRLSVDAITSKSISSFAVENPNIFYVSAGEVRVFGLLLKNNDLKFTLSKELANQKISKIVSNGDAVAIIFQNKELYIFGQQNPAGLKIGEAENIIASPDNQKFAFWNANGELKIYYIDDYQKEITKTAGDISILETYQNGVKNAYWYKDSRYLTIETKANTIYFIEIDDRQPINNYVISDNSSNAYYDQNSNRLYFSKEGGIYFANVF